jgi:hypothetical protein
MHAVLTHWQTGIPDFPICGWRPIGTPIPDSRPNRETGDFPIPDSGRFGNRGFPPRFPAKSGIGGTGIGDFRVWPGVQPRPATGPGGSPPRTSANGGRPLSKRDPYLASEGSVLVVSICGRT